MNRSKRLAQPVSSPLEDLVALQLLAISAREKQLGQRYRKLHRTPSTVERRKLAFDLRILHLRIDRLNRMMDAIA